jgi:TetR/AcrR family acrAB operon transcriptional repressor
MPRTKEAFEAMRQTTRYKIETAALSLFARKGLSVKIGEIAGASGVSQGLMYSHYPSKDALIAELIRQATTISSKTIMDFSESDGTAAGKVKSISNMMCQMFTKTPVGIDYFMFIAQVGMSDFKIPEASWYSAEIPNPVESLAQVIAQGQAECSVVHGDPLQLSIVYWAVIQGLCCYSVTGMPVSPDSKMLNRILLMEDFL